MQNQVLRVVDYSSFCDLFPFLRGHPDFWRYMVIYTVQIVEKG